MNAYPYIWRLRKYRPDRYGHPCRLLAKGTGPGPRNELVEFEDGERVVGAKWSVRTRPPASQREMFA